MRAVHSMRRACSAPMTRGRCQVQPVSATVPSRRKMALKRAAVEAMRMSQARDSPAPTATPFTAAMTGLRQWYTVEVNR